MKKENGGWRQPIHLRVRPGVFYSDRLSASASRSDWVCECVRVVAEISSTLNAREGTGKPRNAIETAEFGPITLTPSRSLELGAWYTPPKLYDKGPCKRTSDAQSDLVGPDYGG